MSVGAWEVFKRMSDMDDQALRMAPLSNVIEARLVKHGTEITIGFGSNVVSQMLNGDFVGGLILVDRKRFEELKSEMEREQA